MSEAGGPADAAWLRDQLVPWYRRVARDLPWRRPAETADGAATFPPAYHVLLSELMLQQTRVETVIPYFDRFIARWPRIEDLASADEHEVMLAWAGLGYYRRARNLLAAARAAVAAGGLPSDPIGLAALPGIGPYTAGAIASIAFGRPVAAVDGNVERVLSRVDGWDGDPASVGGKRHLQARAGSISQAGVAGDVSQGLMELGATVCTPRSPRCGGCPWSERCVALATGRVDELPRKKAKKAPKVVHAVYGILTIDGRVLVGRRPEGLLGGLWEPPGDEVEVDEEAPVDALVAAFRRRVGRHVEVLRPLGVVTHQFTHRTLHARVYEVRAVRSQVEVDDRSYEALDLLDAGDPQLPLSTLARKLLALGDARQLPLVDR